MDVETLFNDLVNSVIELNDRVIALEELSADLILDNYKEKSEVEPTPANQLDASGYYVESRIYIDGMYLLRPLTKEEEEHNEYLDAKRFAKTPEVSRFTKLWRGITDEPGYKWVNTDLGVKRVKILKDKKG